MQIALTNAKGEDVEDRLWGEVIPRVGERLFFGEHKKCRTYEVLRVTYCTHKPLGQGMPHINLADCTVKRVKS